MHEINIANAACACMSAASAAVLRETKHSREVCVYGLCQRKMANPCPQTSLSEVEVAGIKSETK